jgi:hypothetical protein
LFVVRVPVLSVQMVVADPIVSQAARWRTKDLSAIILRIEYASVRVTANGSPSGTATTTIVTCHQTFLERILCHHVAHSWKR